MVRVTPNREKAMSIMKMVRSTIEMTGEIDQYKYPSHVTKEYYEAIRELMSVILILDGYRTYGESAHVRLIRYMKINYQELTPQDIMLVEELREIRNRVAYDGFFVDVDFLERKKGRILDILTRLSAIAERRLHES